MALQTALATFVVGFEHKEQHVQNTVADHHHQGTPLVDTGTLLVGYALCTVQTLAVALLAVSAQHSRPSRGTRVQRYSFIGGRYAIVLREVTMR